MTKTPRARELRARQIDTGRDRKVVVEFWSPRISDWIRLHTMYGLPARVGHAVVRTLREEIKAGRLK